MQLRTSLLLWFLHHHWQPNILMVEIREQELIWGSQRNKFWSLGECSSTSEFSAESSERRLKDPALAGNKQAPKSFGRSHLPKAITLGAILNPPKSSIWKQVRFPLHSPKDEFLVTCFYGLLKWKCFASYNKNHVCPSFQLLTYMQVVCDKTELKRWACFILSSFRL